MSCVFLLNAPLLPSPFSLLSLLPSRFPAISGLPYLPSPFSPLPSLSCTKSYSPLRVDLINNLSVVLVAITAVGGSCCENCGGRESENFPLSLPLPPPPFFNAKMGEYNETLMVV